ncbi:MAG TPA: type I methionyl aminopeptidase [Gemmatimonas aurantiaca]|uniref:Methionine aminopeptidase n=2 Tax=Gemmatimonas aurantiaca TaxID=173480 RepID=C1A6S7_GEMAT|nr:type I methionyl aminopeptidase [Gemmatimonas aurantiaca]BAH37937.1 methionine aminopeptidase [Gemmatimonas aurantiaca T-27]HCT56714.1 type I methionyl aminopeptidase [Gemmatimonas aurantiaca]
MVLGSSAPATLLKSPREIEIMARGGVILHATLMHLKDQVRAGISTLELDQMCEAFIRSHAGAEPAFKGLYGFPGSACISINEEVVHGIPSRKRVLRDGDIVTLDVGVKLDGMYTDSAITVPVGEIDEETQRLLDVTRASLDAGIAAAVADNHVGDIGAAVQAVVEAAGFGVVRELVGHGVGFSPHEELQIPNYGKPKRGKKLSVGLTIAIEPMVNVGTAKIRTLSDKWTVVTADGKRSAHFEHTVAITEDGPRIITLP